MRAHATFGLALLMVLGLTMTAAAEESTVDRFTFARPPAPESTVDPDRLSLDIDRWSTDEERDHLIATIAESGVETLLTAFRDVSRVGTLRWPGGLEYTVRYARRENRDDGSEIVLVVDRPLWMWWDSTAGSTPYPFTVVQIRLDEKHMGEGRVSRGVTVSSDNTFGAVLSDFAQAPAVIADVRREADVE